MKDQILLLIDHKKNRELLAGLLSQRYEVHQSYDNCNMDAHCDLVIVDGTAIDRCWDRIASLKKEVDPLFLPILLMTSRADIGLVTRHLWKSIDDIIVAPIEKIELMARVEVMLRARRQSRDLAAANQMQINMLAMISHELRTPLTSIKGFSTTLLTPEIRFEPEERHEFLSIIDDEANKMSSLIDQLLDLSRLQAGVFSIRPDVVRFDAVLQSATAQLRALSDQHHLLTDIPNDLPLLKVDVQRIEQVLVNLVGNACKYSPPDSVIWLKAQAVDGHVVVAVMDQGPGIPPEHRTVVFEAFRQLQKNGKRSGAGLGLAICKALVEAHGGRIWIDNHYNTGTMISFELPCYGVEQLSVSSAAAS